MSSSNTAMEFSLNGIKWIQEIWYITRIGINLKIPFDTCVLPVLW